MNARDGFNEAAERPPSIVIPDGRRPIRDRAPKEAYLAADELLTLMAGLDPATQ